MLGVHKGSKGFTLAELLIIITIIGIIAAIMAPAGTAYARKSGASVVTGSVERSDILIQPVVQGHALRGLRGALRP
jgi:prepilin-type N-terminal cleavage/methylation domain-containing protein